jgi:hypothetical protein
LKITAANGLAIPYKGYVELDVEANGQLFEKLGFLVVEESQSMTSRNRKREVPGLLGINILRELTSRSNEENLKNSAEKTSVWPQVMSLFDREIKADTPVVKADQNGLIGYARNASSNPMLLPAGTTRTIEATAPHPNNGLRYTALIEGLPMEDSPLPRGVLVAPSYSQVVHGGTLVKLANFNDEDVYIPGKAILGQIMVCEEQNPVTTVEVQEISSHEISVGECKTPVPGRLMEANEVEEIMSQMDIGPVPDEIRNKLAGIVAKYPTLFSRGEHDLGYCDKIKHRIATKDDIPSEYPTDVYHPINFRQ